jgi:hypothetical protein
VDLSSALLLAPQVQTHLLPDCDNPLFFNSPLRVATVSPFQFLCEDNKTAEARLALCCCIGLADTALAVPAEADAEDVVVDFAARKSPVDTLRLIIVCVYMWVKYGYGWVWKVVFGTRLIGSSCDI